MSKVLETSPRLCHKGDQLPSTGQLVFENQPRKRSLWNVSEAASFLQVSPRTIRDLVYRRRIPYRKVNKSLRFDPEEIERWTLPTKE